jgi:hypothetical protein
VCASSGIRIMNEGFGQSELANRQSEIPQSSFGWGDDTLILRLVKQRGRPERRAIAEPRTRNSNSGWPAIWLS